MATTAFDRIVQSITDAGGSKTVTSWQQFQRWRRELTARGGRYAELGNLHQVVLEHGHEVLYLTFQKMAATAAR